MVEVRVRNRFVAVPGAEARRAAANTWEVRVPRTAEVARALRVRDVTLEAFDDAVVAIDGQTSTQALGSGETAAHVVVTVVI